MVISSSGCRLRRPRNVGPTSSISTFPTLIAFRVGAEDAKTLGKEFSPKFGIDELISLPNPQFCIRMLVKGEFVRAFSGRTIDIAMPNRRAA